MRDTTSQLLILLLSVAIGIGGCKKSPEQTQTRGASKPNIILFVADDHGKDALGCYGNPVIQTPHLDSLAASGVTFSNAFCTSASCAASRSVILAGKYGHATASYGHTQEYHHFSTYDTVLSLPVMLEREGYYTARIGKYHLAPDTVYRFNTVLKADPRSTWEMAETCADVFQSDKPFFLYFCTDDPHRAAPFTPNVWNQPNNFGNKPEGYPHITPVTYDPKDVVVPDFLPDTKECREELAQYYQSVSRIDQGFGRLMQLLKASGKAENTVVIYISDNGMAFPGAKTTVYNPGIELPCIIKAPNMDKKGITNNAMISWVDLTPTLLDFAGVSSRKYSFQGRSFKSILTEENPAGWDHVYAAHTFHEITMYYPMRVYQGSRYKLIWNIAYGLPYPFASDLWASSTWQSIHRSRAPRYGKRTVDAYLHRPEFELYDLQNDPDEIINLAAKPAYKTVVDSLKANLKTFQLQTRDPWYIMWDNDASLQGSGVRL